MKTSLLLFSDEEDRERGQHFKKIPIAKRTDKFVFGKCVMLYKLLLDRGVLLVNRVSTDENIQEAIAEKQEALVYELDRRKQDFDAIVCSEILPSKRIRKRKRSTSQDEDEENKDNDDEEDEKWTAMLAKSALKHKERIDELTQCSEIAIKVKRQKTAHTFFLKLGEKQKMKANTRFGHVTSLVWIKEEEDGEEKKAEERPKIIEKVTFEDWTIPIVRNQIVFFGYDGILLPKLSHKKKWCLQFLSLFPRVTNARHRLCMGTTLRSVPCFTLFGKKNNALFFFNKNNQLYSVSNATDPTTAKFTFYPSLPMSGRDDDVIVPRKLKLIGEEQEEEAADSGSEHSLEEEEEDVKQPQPKKNKSTTKRTKVLEAGFHKNFVYAVLSDNSLNVLHFDDGGVWNKVVTICDALSSIVATCKVGIDVVFCVKNRNRRLGFSLFVFNLTTFALIDSGITFSADIGYNHFQMVALGGERLLVIPHRKFKSLVETRDAESTFFVEKGGGGNWGVRHGPHLTCERNRFLLFAHHPFVMLFDQASNDIEILKYTEEEDKENMKWTKLSGYLSLGSLLPQHAVLPWCGSC